MKTVPEDPTTPKPGHILVTLALHFLCVSHWGVEGVPGPL